MKMPSVEIKEVADDFLVSEQIVTADLAPIAAQGIRSVLLLRPDAEARGQPNHRQILDAAHDAGLEARFLPIELARLGAADMQAFTALMRRMPKPVLGVCGTGRRAVTLWALSQAGRMPADEILQRAAAAGFDLSDLSEALA